MPFRPEKVTRKKRRIKTEMAIIKLFALHANAKTQSIPKLFALHASGKNVRSFTNHEKNEIYL